MCFFQSLIGVLAAALGGKSHFLFLGADGAGRRSEMAEELVLYLLGVKIRDLVPFTMSHTLVNYHRPSWYVLGCFSLNEISEL